MTGAGVAAAIPGVLIRSFMPRPIPVASAATTLCRPVPFWSSCPQKQHLLYVSIVGVDSIPFGYYRQKLHCEELIADSEVASTILRTTQFHELAAMMFGGLQRLPIAPLPSGFLFHRLPPGKWRARIVDLLDGSPVGRADDFGGPEVLPLPKMAEAWRICRIDLVGLYSSSTRTCRQSVSRRAQHLPPPC